MSITLEIKDATFRKYLEGVKSRTRDLRPAMLMASVWMKKQTDLTFEMLAHGGKFRGVTWKPFSPNTKYRHSGAKVTAASKLLQDSGRTRRSIQTDVKHDRFILKAARANSAAINDIDRKFLFASSNDRKKIGNMTIIFINTGKLEVPEYGN